MSDPSNQSQLIQGWIDRLAGGDAAAADKLLECAFERLTKMARKMKADFPGVGRWEQTGDVTNNAALRLRRALADVPLQDSRHFYRLAAVQIRRELIDLSRHYRRLQDHHHSQPQHSGAAPAHDPGNESLEPGRLAERAEIHEQVESLPQELRETVDLLWYHGLSQEEAGSVLGISTRQVKRRWRSARLLLHDRLGSYRNRRDDDG